MLLRWVLIHVVARLSSSLSILRLVISARNENLLSEAILECQQYTQDVHMVVGDVGKEEDCVRLVHTAVEQLGGVDILILNAAYTPELEWFTSDRDIVRIPS